MVISDRNLYINKVEEFMNENGFVKLDNNPTSRLINKVKNFKVSKEFEDEFGKYRNLILPNPKIPKLYGLPKLHKDNIPIRPIVSYINTPVYKISKFLSDKLKDLTEFKPTYGIKNSGQLVDSLRNLQIPEGAKLISLDAKNLYTSIPPDECITILDKKLTEKNVTPELKKDITNLFKVSLGQNFCQFNNGIYKLDKGLPMGAPPSSLIAEIFMDHLEEILFNLRTPIIRHIFKYYRYVDDIFIIFTGGTDLIWVLLELFNSLHKNIHFTLEIGFNQINFLDLTLTLEEDRISVDVYRKESQTVAIINESSNHPAYHKFSALNTYLHRLLSLPLSRGNFEKEDNKQPVKRLSLPFYGKMCYPIANIFRRHNIDIVFKAKNCLYNYLLNCKDMTPILEKNGVYKLNCKTCDRFYIGKTFRALGTRVSEHIRNYNDKSSFGKHLKINNHEFDKDENVELLHNLDRGNKKDKQYMILRPVYFDKAPEDALTRRNM
ncbi:uncharacterized protein LOC123686796 [Harmonia axyridis]|uniref:uncharacterized protein LOC123686796 n=1 Tax=Harmonia axyridis TaxID=115357 RepID=UPI001E276B94|nr:uncharacterized protein LOC123686796 [Harmonia axyridis]